MTELKSYVVWDAPTRWFHWINTLCVIGLVGVGLVILNANALGVTNPGKISLKTTHSWIGYVFAINLLWRMLWAFVGNRFARWGEILPVGGAYFRALRRYIASLRSGVPEQYLGHNPLARLSVAALFALMLVQAVTGLVLAGTDLFQPPIGHWIARWVAAPGVDPATLVPYAPELYDEAAWQNMRAFRKPFVTLHQYAFYGLSVLVPLHIAAVVMTEIKEGGGIITAMFTGRKTLSRPPADES